MNEILTGIWLVNSLLITAVLTLAIAKLYNSI